MLRSCDCRGKRNKPTAVLQSRAAASCGLMSRKARATKRQVGFVRVASTSSAHTAGFPRRRMLGCFSVSPPSFLPLSAPFAAPTNAVIVTPATLKADVVPTTGVVLAPNLAGVRFILLLFLLVLQCQCVEHTHLFLFFTQPSGFHVVSHSQKSPKPIVPKEKSYPSSRKHQKASASDGEVSLCSTTDIPEISTWPRPRDPTWFPVHFSGVERKFL